VDEKPREARLKAVKPETDITVKFKDELYKQILELKDLLRDAEVEEDVPAIAIDLLYQARGKVIRVGSGPDADVYDLWRRSAE
jgi:hypothetical protein